MKSQRRNYTQGLHTDEYPPCVHVPAAIAGKKQEHVPWVLPHPYPESVQASQGGGT